MKLSVDKNLLLKHLSYTQGIVDTRSQMMVLSHVLFKTNQGRLCLSSTDLESSMYTSIPANISEDGGVCLPAKKILEITEKIPDQNVKISTNDNDQVEINYSTGKTKIKTLPIEDFPEIPKPEDFSYITIESVLLEEALQKTLYSIGSDDIKKNLTGVFFDMTTQNKLVLVTTDGHRMSLTEEDFQNTKDGSFILPKKAAQELKRFIKDTEVVSVGYTNSFFICDNGQTSILSRLIGVEFPEYKRVIPNNFSNTFEVERKQLLESLQRVSVVLSEKTKGARIFITKDGLEIKSTSDEGETVETIHITGAEKNIEVGFNVKYLIDALNTFNEERVFVCVNDEISPVCIYSNKNNKHQQLAIVMPMRV